MTYKAYIWVIPQNPIITFNNHVIKIIKKKEEEEEKKSNLEEKITIYS